MMNKHRFILKPYKSREDRKECPCCHVKGCFSQYIDTVGRIAFPPDVGRCNREHKCGYHYTPKQFFHDHPDMKEELMDDAAILSPTLPTPPQPKAERFFFPRSVMESSMSHYRENNFFLFLCSRFGEQAALELAGRYNIGTAKVRKGSCVFWQVDIRGRVCQGKVMFYDASTGNRSHEVHPTWAHTLMRIDKERVGQCFFGEHLLAEFPDLPVGIVESEKSALIMSIVKPDHLWMATGSLNNFNEQFLEPVKDAVITAYPDVDNERDKKTRKSVSYELWRRIAARLNRKGWNITVSSVLEDTATTSQRLDKIDIADIAIGQAKQEFINSLTRKP